MSVGRAGRKTAETLNATDRIIEALELAGKEAERLQVSTIPCNHGRWVRDSGKSSHTCLIVQRLCLKSLPSLKLGSLMSQ